MQVVCGERWFRGEEDAVAAVAMVEEEVGAMVAMVVSERRRDRGNR